MNRSIQIKSNCEEINIRNETLFQSKKKKFHEDEIIRKKEKLKENDYQTRIY